LANRTRKIHIAGWGLIWQAACLGYGEAVIVGKQPRKCGYLVYVAIAIIVLVFVYLIINHPVHHPNREKQTSPAEAAPALKAK
jgi:predicted membrane channel-forming protein YqfA (hemolysin III family)